MSRQDEERQKELEPPRGDYAKEQIEKLGYELVNMDEYKIQFMHKEQIVTLFYYSGWHTGKTITDGRGIHKLLKQIK